ncbi:MULTISPECIES: hypothetical protein [unclassified Halomonas]|uniref:hypothetical protein n=1 Tax=unclassified Halomonas TaxID=2609666 RepID=UPI001CF31266|nr:MULTISPECIES: hypothetical protein [unclassified Halomonas]MCA8864754.1 hypothetical protein [Halomonas sp. SBBP1]UZH11884.1 hypothetical protein OM794_09145 [Halomonas sp. BDJS001]
MTSLINALCGKLCSSDKTISELDNSFNQLVFNLTGFRSTAFHIKLDSNLTYRCIDKNAPNQYVPTLWLASPSCNQHAPDEYLLETIIEQGLKLAAGMLWNLSEPKEQAFKPTTTTTHRTATKAE